ncbi:MAG: response regulator [bacterium]
MPNLRVMIVEAESIAASEIEDKIQRLGYTVCAITASGEKAIELARQTSPDLIIMGIHLDGKIDGIEAAKVISEEQNIPIILLTSYYHPCTIERAEQAGVFAYIVKPFDEHKLCTSIEIAINKHQMNMKIRGKERLLTSVLNSIGDGVIATDTSGKIVFINPVACQICGWTCKEATGEQLENVFRISIKERQIAHGIASTEAKAGLPHRKSHSVLESRQGRRIHVDWRISQITGQDGRILGKVLIFRDISERIQAENELREARDYAHRLLDITPVMVFVIDNSNRISHINRCCREVLNYSDDELVGCSWVDKLVVEDDRNLVNQFLSNSSWSSGSIKSIECRVATKQGEIREVLFHITKVGDCASRMGDYLIAGEDLTECRRVEKERHELESKLHHAQKMEAIGTLASGVAHEFNNMVTAIRGNAELALMHIDPGSPIHHDLEQIKKVADNASVLTRQLLAFSRRKRKQEKVDLNKAVSNTIGMLERLLCGLSIRCNLEENLPQIRCETGEIEQVLMNLVLNAKDAMPYGGTITIRTESRGSRRKGSFGNQSQESNAQYGGFVNLIVEDTGIGMDESVRSRVFEPFFTTKEAGKGTGLGLSVVYGIVRRYGGEIDIESELGKGTKVIIKFPVADQAEPESQDDTSWEESLGRGEKILVVEDDEDVLEFLKKLLTAKGYWIETATSVKDAISYLENDNEIKVVLSDVVLCDGNAFDIVERIDQSFPSVGIILSSGYYDSRGGYDRALSQGIPFIYKPYSLFDLLSLIRKTIKSKMEDAEEFASIESVGLDKSKG